MLKNKQSSLITLSMIFYILSLIFPGFYIKKEASGINGGLSVLLGFQYVFYGGAALTWLANPLLWLSWVHINNFKLSLILSLTSFIFSLSFLFFDKIVIDCPSTDYSTVHCKVKILGYGFGYILWVLSSLLVVLNRINEKKYRKEICC